MYIYIYIYICIYIYIHIDRATSAPAKLGGEIHNVSRNRARTPSPATKSSGFRGFDSRTLSRIHRRCPFSRMAFIGYNVDTHLVGWHL